MPTTNTHDEVGERTAKHFHKTAHSFDRLYQDTSAAERAINRMFRPSIYERARVTVEEVRKLGAPSVLDIGCGSGVNALAFVENGASSVLGLDFAQEMLALSRQRGVGTPHEKQMKFEEADFLTWEPKGQKFDLTAALGVFDYVAEPEAFWNKMLDVSKHTILASFPNYGMRGMIRKVRYTAMNCPLFLFEEDQPKRWTSHPSDWQFEVPYRDESVFVALARRK